MASRTDLIDIVGIPVAYCWTCRTDVVVWSDFTASGQTIPRCTQCDTQLNQWGVDPGIRPRPVAELDQLGLEILDRSPNQACGSGGGCGGGCGDGAGCASTGGGGGCWVPATEGRAAVMASEGTRGCGSCGIKRACADKRRERRREALQVVS